MGIYRVAVYLVFAVLMPLRAHAVVFEENAFDPNSNEGSLVSTESEVSADRLHNARNGFGGGFSFGYSPNTYEDPLIGSFGFMRFFFEKRLFGIIGIQPGVEVEMGFNFNSTTSSTSTSTSTSRTTTSTTTGDGVHPSTSTSVRDPSSPFMMGLTGYISFPIYPLLFGNWSLSAGPEWGYGFRAYSFSTSSTAGDFTMSQSVFGLFAALQWHTLVLRVSREIYGDSSFTIESSSSKTAAKSVTVVGAAVNTFALQFVFGF